MDIVTTRGKGISRGEANEGRGNRRREEERAGKKSKKGKEEKTRGKKGEKRERKGKKGKIEVSRKIGKKQVEGMK